MKLVALRSGKLLWHFCSHTQVSPVARKPLNYHLHMDFIEKKHACTHALVTQLSSQDALQEEWGGGRLNSKSVFLVICILGSVHVRALEL